MTTGCWGDQFDDDDAGGRHRQGDNNMDISAFERILSAMDDGDYKALMRDVERARRAGTPSMQDGAELLKQQGNAMRIPGGELTPRMRQMLADANGDSFTVQDGRAGRDIDLGN